MAIESTRSRVRTRLMVAGTSLRNSSARCPATTRRRRAMAFVDVSVPCRSCPASGSCCAGVFTFALLLGTRARRSLRAPQRIPSAGAPPALGTGRRTDPWPGAHGTISSGGRGSGPSARAEHQGGHPVEETPWGAGTPISIVPSRRKNGTARPGPAPRQNGRLFPAHFLRRVAGSAWQSPATRSTADTTPALSRPKELDDYLEASAAGAPGLMTARVSRESRSSSCNALFARAFLQVKRRGGENYACPGTEHRSRPPTTCPSPVASLLCLLPSNRSRSASRPQLKRAS
jgi:hypothetical protein